MADKKPRKPLDAGFKRSMIVIGGVVGVSVAALLYLISANGSKTEHEPSLSNLGTVPVGQQVKDPQLNEATRRRLARVQTSEAKKAHEEGRTYIPDVIISGGEPIQIEAPKATPPKPAAEPRPEDAPPPTRANNEMGRQQQALSQARDQQERDLRERYKKGIERQLASVLQGLSPASVQEVSIIRVASADSSQAQGAGAAGAAGGAAPNTTKGPELVGADEIIAAQTLTPIDTDKSRFVMVELLGGKLDGAQLRGEVVPMATSGDVEDVGIRLTSMRMRNGDFYQIDAIALNEQTASDAMDGEVDRRFFSRNVMPILMAGLSGISTYFTAQGTPATSVATDVGQGTAAIVVDQDKATKDEAKKQGIGDAIDKAVQRGDAIVNKAGGRPNQVTVDAYTPIGVIFNTPVFQKS